MPRLFKSNEPDETNNTDEYFRRSTEKVLKEYLNSREGRLKELGKDKALLEQRRELVYRNLNRITDTDTERKDSLFVSNDEFEDLGFPKKFVESKEGKEEEIVDEEVEEQVAELTKKEVMGMLKDMHAYSGVKIIKQEHDYDKSHSTDPNALGKKILKVTTIEAKGDLQKKIQAQILKLSKIEIEAFKKVKEATLDEFKASTDAVLNTFAYSSIPTFASWNSKALYKATQDLVKEHQKMLEQRTNKEDIVSAIEDLISANNELRKQYGKKENDGSLYIKLSTQLLLVKNKIEETPHERHERVKRKKDAEDLAIEDSVADIEDDTQEASQASRRSSSSRGW